MNFRFFRLRWGCALLSQLFVTLSSQSQTSNVGPSQVLWINGTVHDTNYVTGGFANFGTVLLQSSDGAWASDLTVTNGMFTNALGGTVNVNTGTGGPRVIAASVTNLGSFNANDSMSFSQGNASINNNGQFNIAAGATVSMSDNGQVFNQNAGTLTNAGALSLSSIEFNFNGGVIAGNALYLAKSALALGPAATNLASFILAGSGSTYSGDLWPGQSLWLRGDATVGSSVVVASNGFNNSGSILLQSADGGYESSLAVINGQLVNASPGTFTISPGTGGPRNFYASLMNYGTFNVSNSVTMSQTNRVYNNDGLFKIAPNQTVTINGLNQVFTQSGGTLQIDGVLDAYNITFNYGGGTINGASGAPYLIDSQLNLGSQAVNPAAFWITGSASTITGNIQAGQTVWVRGSGPGSSTSFVVTNGFVNSGTLRLESVDGGYNTYFYINNGALTNASGGVVNINNGEGGAHFLSQSAQSRRLQRQ